MALADPYAWANHPDVAWRLPEHLPPVSDMRAGIATLERSLQSTDRAHIATCLQKLAVGFNMTQTKDEARLRMEIWIEANGDLPMDLWTKGTTELLRTYTFGMPKPSHLREIVDDELSTRQRDLRRTREMLDSASDTKPVERESWDVRVKTLRDSFKRIGNTNKAASYERQLAEHEGREPEEWARAL